MSQTDTLAPSHNTQALLVDLTRRLKEGERFTNASLTSVASPYFGGTVATGAVDSRTVYDYFEAAVNLHIRAHAQRLLQMDFADALVELRSLLQQLPTQTSRTVEQMQFQQFSSPPTVAFLAARLLNALPNETGLEPSAGTGNLAVWMEALGLQIVCNELAERRREILGKQFGFTCYGVDAALLHDLLPLDIKPKYILMNPPFSSSAGKTTKNDTSYGARHLESALSRLAPSGRLVAVMGEGMGFEKSKFRRWWQSIASKYTVRANLHLDGREYRKYGTSFDFQIIVIDKTGRTPGSTWNEQLDSIIWGDAKTVEGAWARLQSLTQKSEEEDEGPFVPYVPARLIGGQRHPARIVETRSMASVPPPPITYRPDLPAEIINDGKLSTIQLERVIYAGQRHEMRLPDGARGGFFNGDMTGVGKGRTNAAIIIDNWRQGRKRAVWFSVSKDLAEAAKIDLRDLGYADIPLVLINEDSPDADISLGDGILFCTYSSLIAKSKLGARRFDQIRRWLGPDGVIIFDEGHKAKNAMASGRGEPTQTGQAVLDLQDPAFELENLSWKPDYRVVYASATGATEPRNMVYMTRLGLWGEGTQFDSFESFMVEVDNGGIGAMEMIAREMKMQGLYLSSQISFGKCPRSGKAVEYRERIHELTPEQERIYDSTTIIWQHILKNMEDAIEITQGDKRARSRMLSNFWAAHQRFFRMLIFAFKVPTVLKVTKEALEEGYSVVLSVASTGEARAKDRVAQALAAGERLEDIDLSPREFMADLVRRSFPVKQYEYKEDKASGKVMAVVAKDKQGHDVLSQEALELQKQLLLRLNDLHLPQHPLDQIVNALGPEKVAEITGRSYRMIEFPDGHVEYCRRAPDDVKMAHTNVHEMAEFQSGRKRMAIISPAGSMGISLHSSLEAQNQQRRMQITVEFEWAADQQLQKFGRTHRTNQAVPPIYTLIFSSLAGESRFVATIVKRLASLGALTQAERTATNRANLDRFNFETKEGRAALTIMLLRMMRGVSVPGLEDPKQALRDIGLLVETDEGEDIRKENLDNVPRFLNRILALDVARQRALFDHYAALFDEVVENAKANGFFDEGLTDIKALDIRMKQAPRVVSIDMQTKAHTIHYVLEADQPSGKISFETANKMRERKNGAFFRHKKQGHIILALPSRTSTERETGSIAKTYSVTTPEAERVTYLKADELEIDAVARFTGARYERITAEEARAWWTLRFNALPVIKTQDMHILGGSLLALWHRLKIGKGAPLKVVRVSTSGGERVVGVLIAQANLQAVLREIGINIRPQSAEQLFNAVLYEGGVYNLTEGLTFQASFLHGEKTLEIKGGHYQLFRRLQSIEGIIPEMYNYQQRFLVPTDPVLGIPVLENVLEAFPLLVGETEEDQAEQPLSIEELINHPPINLASWYPLPANNNGALHAYIERAPEPQIDVQPVIIPTQEYRPGSQPTLFEL